MGLVPYLKKKKDHREFLSPRHSKETFIHEPGHELSPDIKAASSVTLDYPASRTVRDKCVLWKPLWP